MLWLIRDRFAVVPGLVFTASTENLAYPASITLRVHGAGAFESGGAIGARARVRRRGQVPAGAVGGVEGVVAEPCAQVSTVGVAQAGFEALEGFTELVEECVGGAVDRRGLVGLLPGGGQGEAEERVRHAALAPDAASGDERLRRTGGRRRGRHHREIRRIPA